MTEHPDRPWGTLTMAVLKSARDRGFDSEGHVYLVAYDLKDPPTYAIACNLFDPSGGICRLPRDHVCDHMSFDVSLVAASGIYVTAIIDPGATG